MTRVLVCDDAADLRLLLRLTLEQAGHEVLEADGGEAALRLLDAEDTIHLVLLDVQMPVIDGWGVLAAVRDHPVHHEVPVAMCTVKFSHEDLVHAWRLGCDDYVSKPFDLEVLTATVQALLESDLKTRLQRRERELRALTKTPVA